MRSDYFQKTEGNQVEFFHEGEAYYRRYLDLIHTAKFSVHLQTYIFQDDNFGRAVQDELMAAARRGVQVYLLIDSVGSFGFPEEAVIRLKEAGVHFCRFNGIRFRWLGQWGRRLHHKVLLADHARAFIGGINVISDSYRNESVVPHQLDFALHVAGPVCIGLARYCRKIFGKACGQHIEFDDMNKTQTQAFADGVTLQISINDWIYRRWRITRQYSQLTHVADKDIVIINSYFFPRRKFMRQLRNAVKRGVRVRLILPRFSDWPSYVKATRYLYNYFLRNGIEVYEWKNSIMHGKLATIDNSWCTIGSFNLNYTSYQQNLEMNVDVYDAPFAKRVNQQIQNYIDQGCEKIDPQSFLEKTSYRDRFSYFFFYIIMSLVANFSIGLAFQEEEERGRLYKIISVAASLVLFLVGIIGMIMPVIPGIPFLVMSLVLMARQVISNNRNV